MCPSRRAAERFVPERSGSGSLRGRPCPSSRSRCRARPPRTCRVCRD
ncbi:hypothetical protein ACFW04_013748 [Cataglyphis niger]